MMISKSVFPLLNQNSNLNSALSQNLDFEPVSDFNSVQNPISNSTLTLPSSVASGFSENSNFEIISLGGRPDYDVYSQIKEEERVSDIFRLSVFLTNKNKLLFSAPSGPSVSKNLNDLEFCAKAGVFVIQKLGIRPSIGIISGGRCGDLGRNKIVDQTLRDAEALERKLKKDGIFAKHHTILIEEAVKEVNFLILPDSLSGEMVLKSVTGIGNGIEIGQILLLKPEDREPKNKKRKIYIEQITQKGDLKNLEILKEALEISFNL
ncbi:MAG: hypothetical protein RBQ94_04100 [Methanimicrococcus sp.]|nr:hypothetical protein [Methanimicrococcus sp.]